MFGWLKKKSEKTNSKTPDEDFRFLIVPDEYHINFAGISKNSGNQVFITTEILPFFDEDMPLDLLIAYEWDNDGVFINAQVEEIGVRGKNNDAARDKAYETLLTKYKDVEQQQISVSPCKINYRETEFGMIKETDEFGTTVTMMPGDCICWIEPFNGDYDT
jgi:hypothetical protein